MTQGGVPERRTWFLKRWTSAFAEGFILLLEAMQNLSCFETTFWTRGFFMRGITTKVGCVNEMKATSTKPAMRVIIDHLFAAPHAGRNRRRWPLFDHGLLGAVVCKVEVVSLAHLPVSLNSSRDGL